MASSTREKLTISHQESLFERLQDPEYAESYLQAALDLFEECGDEKAFLLSLQQVAEARGGMTKLARDAKLNRESLYKSLSAKGNPKFSTLGAIIRALGFKLHIKLV